MYSLFTRAASKLFVLCLLCTLALPTHAATLSELTASLQSLQAALKNYQMSQLGRSPVSVLTAATTITVANDQQLFDALNAATGGEVIKLQPGTYSAITLDPGFWKLRVGTLVKTDFAANLSTLTAPVTITSADLTRRAVVQSIQITNGAKNFRIENLSFRPTPGGTAAALIGSDITFTRNDISYGDSTNWTAADWNAKAGNGVDANGINIDISYNYLKNINFGINGGTGSHVHHNKIENFIGDGLRGWDNSTFDNNLVKNPYEVNDNHIDGFQSFTSVGGSIKNVILRNNTFIVEPSTNPLRSNMQGIGLFDGWYDNWIIENNLILVKPWHGIGLMGARSTVVQNNVAISPTNLASEAGTWITVSASKAGEPSTGITYKNNYANTVMNTIDGNVKVPFTDYAKYFVSPATGDFTFKSSAVPFPVGAIIDMNLLAPEPYGVGGTTTVLPPVTPAPTLSFGVSLASVTTGSVATLTWGSTDAASCTASGDWGGTKVLSGSESTGVLGTAGTKNYSLVCTGAGGTVTKAVSVAVTDAVVVPITTTFKIGDRISVKNNVNVRTTGLIDASTLIGVNPLGSQGVLVAGPTVSNDAFGVITWFNINFDTGFDGWVGADNYILLPPVITSTTTSVLPTLTLSASPAAVLVGNSSIITWSSANATVCAAGGGWSGAKAMSGSESTGLLITVGTTTYTLACTGTGGTVSKSVTVRAVTSGTIATATTTTRATVNNNVNVRATPNGAKLGTQPAGATGTLGTQLSVTTAGHIWVYVDFDSGVDGWVARRYLTVSEPLVSASMTTVLDVQTKITLLQKQLATLEHLLIQLQAK